jgi:hypothetical protein
MRTHGLYFQIQLHPTSFLVCARRQVSFPVCILAAWKLTIEHFLVGSVRNWLDPAESLRFSTVGKGPTSTALHFRIPFEVVDVGRSRCISKFQFGAERAYAFDLQIMWQAFDLERGSVVVCRTFCHFGREQSLPRLQKPPREKLR